MKSEDPFSLKDRVSIVTGAGQGLGEAIAHALAKAGASVVLTGRTLSKVERVASEINSSGNRAIPIEADISRPNEIKKMVDFAISEFGTVDVLVNNAAVPSFNDVFDTTEEEWDRVIDTNLKGTFFCCQIAGKEMAKRKKGKIINVASTAGLVALTGMTAYSAAKGGVVLLTKTLGSEMARYNIQVNCIAPGFFLSPLNANIYSSNPSLFDATLRRIPLRREGKTEEIAAVAVFLATEASNYITGETIAVDGGWSSFGNVIKINESTRSVRQDDKKTPT